MAILFLSMVLSSAAEPAEKCGVYKYLQTLQAEWQIYP
jgi:hypothetical protein